MSNIILAQASIGSRVEVFIDTSTFCIASYTTTFSIPATVLAQDNTLLTKNLTLLGWGVNDGVMPTGTWGRGTPLYNSHKQFMGTFLYGLLVDKNIPIKSILGGLPVIESVRKPKPSGMTCVGRFCPDPFNPYAEANQPNGTFLCFSCRQKPACMR